MLSIITFKRGSAKYCFEDDFAFLNGNRANLIICQTEITRPIKAKFCAVNCVGDAQNGSNQSVVAALQICEIYAHATFCTIPYLTFALFFFLLYIHKPGASPDLHARWLKRRGLIQGSAFWGLITIKLVKGVYFPKPTKNRHDFKFP
jgi:hypothetical protein